MSSTSTDSHNTAVPRQPSSDTVRQAAAGNESIVPTIQNQNASGRRSDEQGGSSALTDGAVETDVPAQADDPGGGRSSTADNNQPTVSSPGTPQPPPSPSPAPDASVDDNKLKEKSEDLGSFNTIATNEQTRHSRRKADKTSVSEGASTSTSTNVHSPTTNGKAKVHAAPARKPSFFIKLVRRIVPCISATPRTLDLDLDDTRALSTREKEKPSTPKEVSNETFTPSDRLDEVPSAPPRTSSATPTSLPPLTITPPSPSADDNEVLVSSTPILLPKSETEGVTSGAVQAPGSTGESVLSAHAQQHVHIHGHDHARPHPRDASADGDESDETSFTEDEEVGESTPVEEHEDEEDRLILNGGAGIPIGPDGVPRPLLPPIAPQHAGRKCLVLDLDETLVHSSFKSIQSADYVVPVEIEFHWHNVYVIKRPGVDNFLKKMGEIYEVVVFTASLSKYADPVLDKLDIHQVVSHRLFRESCYNHKGNYVKDLSQLGRPIADTIILDNSPASYIFHPNNAVPVSSWFNDPHDTELTDLVPFLSDLSTVDDVRGVLDGGL